MAPLPLFCSNPPPLIIHSQGLKVFLGFPSMVLHAARTVKSTGTSAAMITATNNYANRALKKILDFVENDKDGEAVEWQKKVDDMMGNVIQKGTFSVPLFISTFYLSLSLSLSLSIFLSLSLYLSITISLSHSLQMHSWCPCNILWNFWTYQWARPRLHYPTSPRKQNKPFGIKLVPRTKSSKLR